MSVQVFDDSTVFIVDDDLPFARSVHVLIRAAGLKGEVFSTAEALLEQLDVDQQGCVVLDLRLDGMSGIELLEVMRARGYVMPVLFLTAYADIETAVKSIQFGAIDFLEKPASPDKLVTRIRQALMLDLQLRDVLMTQREADAKFGLLTEREQEVLSLVIKGQSSKQIATTLQISHKTVDKHRTSLMRKLEASNAAELVRFALEFRERSEQSNRSGMSQDVVR